MAGNQYSPTAPIYSEAQLQRYFSRIGFNKPHPSLDESGTQAGLAYLTSLQKYQMAHVPFENLSLHYSTHRVISLDPESLYEKIVDQKRGGWCMENNTFFGTVLRSLGYDIYSAGARINKHMNTGLKEKYGGWSHMINLVKIDGQVYMVDVGFGADGPLQPMPLKDGLVQYGLEPQSMKLTWENIAQNTCSSQRLWVYQHRKDDQSEWCPLYCFTELEFILPDYEIMNHAASTSRTSFFTWEILCTQTILEQEAVVGVHILNKDKVKRRLRGGKVEHLETFETEKQRVDALRKYLGLSLTEKDQRAIQGTISSLSLT